MISDRINGQDDSDKYLFTVGKVVAFRGTADLKFSLMIVTRDLNRDKPMDRSLRQVCLRTRPDGRIRNFCQGKDWTVASMYITLL